MEPSSVATQSHQQQVGQPPGGLATSGQNAQASTSFPSVAPSPFAARAQPNQTPSAMSAASQPSLTKQSSPANSDAPGTPGMMDIDMMDDDEEPHDGGSVQGQGVDNSLRVLPSILPPTAAQWNSFQPPANVPQCVPPSLLSYNIPPSASGSGGITPNRFPTVNGFGFAGSGMNFGGSQSTSRDRTPGAGGSNGFLTEAQKAERAARKAARKEAKRIAKENGEYQSSDDNDVDGKKKKYRCPVEGCNKAYKQANGLKYHLK
jgi:transcription factor SFP1